MEGREGVSPDERTFWQHGEDPEAGRSVAHAGPAGEAGVAGLEWPGGQEAVEGEGHTGTPATGGFVEGRRHPAPGGVQGSPKGRRGKSGACSEATVGIGPAMAATGCLVAGLRDCLK